MTRQGSCPTLLAGLLISAAVSWPAAAQQPAAQPPVAQPSPPPPWAQGRPEANESAMTLAPVAPPPIPTAADKLPVNKLKLPRGFQVEVWASGIPNARTLRVGDNGTVFVGNRFIGKVFAVVDKDGKREVKTIAEALHRPNGLAFHKGALYVAELSRIWRYDDIENNLDSPQKPTLVYDDLPKDEPHGWKFIGVGPDEKLYVPVGAPCNICNPSESHAQIRRMDLDGKSVEVVARGIRNTVGFDWHPETNELWLTDNGRDWMSEDVPNDELNRVTDPGKDHFGFPFCHQGNLPDSEFGWGKSCDDYVPPAALLGPHAAALGMRFYTGDKLPRKYRNSIFIARHGSWNRTQKIGGDIVVAHLDRRGRVTSVEPFLTGFIENNSYIGRPVDMVFLKDGSMLVSDDFNGAIYRVSYGRNGNIADN